MKRASAGKAKSSRAEFVRGFPLEMPVAQVIASGKRKGILIKPSDVHAARYYMRKAAEQQNGESTKSPQKKRGSVAREVLNAVDAGTAALAQRVARETVEEFRTGKVEEDFVISMMKVGTERAKFIVNRLDPQRG